MTHQVIKKSEGFTLIETTVAIFGFAIIAVAVIALVSSIIRTGSQQSGLLSNSDQARKLVFQIVGELRNSVTSSNGAYSLETAGDQQLTFYSNADLDSGVERIRYYTQSGKLWKGVTEYNGLNYNTTTEKSVVVQNDLANGTSTIFSYYDGSYIGSSTQSSLVQPVNVTAVKFIKVTLQIYNKAGIKNTNFYTVTAGGTIRNLKTNLGN